MQLPSNRPTFLAKILPKKKKSFPFAHVTWGFLSLQQCAPQKKPLLHTYRSRLEWTSSHHCTSLRWGHSRHFGDEPKTHPLPLPKVFSVFFFAPKFSPPTYLTSFCTHSIARNLKLEVGAWNKMAEVGAKNMHLKWEGKSGREKVGARSGSLKQKGKNKRVEVGAWR